LKRQVIGALAIGQPLPESVTAVSKTDPGQDAKAVLGGIDFSSFGHVVVAKYPKDPKSKMTPKNIKTKILGKMILFDIY